MKKTIIMAIAGIMMTTSCNKVSNQEANNAAQTSRTAHADMKNCDIEFDGVRFTESLNGGAELVSVNDSVLNFDCNEGRDLFNDPKGTSSNNVPAIFTQVDNTKPFTFMAKVKPGFSPSATYNAAALLLFVDFNLYQKLCFEQDERGLHRVVTVRTDGTSDDNNHDAITSESVYLKIVSDTKRIGNYYSLDGKKWQMARLYKNTYPEKIMLGISSQAPSEGNCLSTFTNLSLDTVSVSDFRLGE